MSSWSECGYNTGDGWQRRGIGSDAQPGTTEQLVNRAAVTITEAPTLVVSDLDGTLLRSDGALGPRTAGSINQFIRRGGWFTYATARSFTSASRVTRGLDLPLPVVTYGGAVIVDPRSGQARPATMLPQAAVAGLLAATEHDAQLEPVLFAMHAGRDRLCWRPDHLTPGIGRFLSRRRGDPRLLPLRDWSAIDASEVFCVAVIGERNALAGLQQAVPRSGVHMTLSLDVYPPGEWWLELSSASATKAAALTGLRRELGAGRLICFGDNQNDLPMFAIADWSLAVANAAPGIRGAADEVVGTNDSDGVARWIAAHAGLA
ncbi:MAG: HAD family phosphatase, partial [Actinobacteria bacterium]|nr:HAD family phosphatase [Actinomycetota bacterium]